MRPVWRCEPNHGSGVFTIALDPVEAQFVLERGWATLDGVRYRVNQNGCPSVVCGDGRVMVRCEIDDREGSRMLLAEAEALRRHAHNDPIETTAAV